MRAARLAAGSLGGASAWLSVTDSRVDVTAVLRDDLRRLAPLAAAVTATVAGVVAAGAEPGVAAGGLEQALEVNE